MGSIALSFGCAADILSHFSCVDRDLADEEIVNLARCEPGFAQDLTRMLAQPWSRIAQRAARVAEPYRRPYYADAALGGMVRPREHIASGEVLVRRQFGERVDRPRRDIGRFQLVEPVRCRRIAHTFGDQRVEFGDVAAAG